MPSLEVDCRLTPFEDNCSRSRDGALAQIDLLMVARHKVKDAGRRKRMRIHGSKPIPFIQALVLDGHKLVLPSQERDEY